MIPKEYIIGGGLLLGLIMLMGGRSSGGGRASSSELGTQIQIARLQAEPALLTGYGQIEQARLAASNSHEKNHYDYVTKMAGISADLAAISGRMGIEYAAKALDANNTAYQNETTRLVNTKLANTNQYDAVTNRQVKTRALQNEVTIKRIDSNVDVLKAQYDRQIKSKQLDIANEDMKNHWRAKQREMDIMKQLNSFGLSDFFGTVTNTVSDLATSGGMGSNMLSSVTGLAGQGMSQGGSMLSGLMGSMSGGGGGGGGGGNGGGGIMGVIGKILPMVMALFA
jgi:hypothetical protein